LGLPKKTPDFLGKHLFRFKLPFVLSFHLVNFGFSFPLAFCAGEDIFAGWFDFQSMGSMSPAASPELGPLSTPASSTTAASAPAHCRPPPPPITACACSLCGMDVPLYLRVGFLVDRDADASVSSIGGDGFGGGGNGGGGGTDAASNSAAAEIKFGSTRAAVQQVRRQKMANRAHDDQR
jgi:hypothetical protein